MDQLFLFFAKRRELIITLFKISYVILLVTTFFAGRSLYYGDLAVPRVGTMGRWAGELAICVYILTLIPGIFRRFGVSNKIVSLLMMFRRYIGIFMYLLVFMHFWIMEGVFWFFQNGFSWGGVPEFEIFGVLAHVILIALVLTSNDWSTKHLGIWWGRIHSLTYLAIGFIFLHVGLGGSRNWAALTAFVGLVELASFGYRYITTQKNMFKNNKNLLVIAIIAIVNALGYGIIIPILYSYSQRFGLSDFQNGLLFATFAICQFISTPLIGRLSDKYGRKPLLIISVAGTAVSFLMMAFAPSAIVLFLARALDGITAGNIPVASAVISDTTEPKDRAKGFGIIGASFGFGFIFGPAISAFTTGFSPAIPFLIAAVVSIIAVILTIILLPETNKHMGEVKKGKIFDFRHLVTSITDEQVGKPLLLCLLYSFAFFLFIYAWQPAAVKIMGLSVQQISIAFTVFGVVGLIAQMVIIPKFTKRFGERASLIGSLFVLTITFASFYGMKSFALLLFVSVFQGIANSFVSPLLQTILSKVTDETSQGSILGLFQSYFSIGQIFGPIAGGAIATISLPTPFLVASGLIFICAILAFQLKYTSHHKEHAF